MPIQSDEAVLKSGHEDSRFPENDDWATTSSGSTHTSDYTWTERTESRDDEEDFTSSEGSAQTGECTEEDDISGGAKCWKRISTWHALKTLDSGYGINNQSDSQDEEEEEEDAILMIPNQKSGKGDQSGNSRNMKLVKAYLLNEETLSELKFGTDLTKTQLTQVKQMLMSHSQ